MHYTSKLDNLYDQLEVDQLEVDQLEVDWRLCTEQNIDIDGTLNSDTDAKPPSQQKKSSDLTFGIYMRQDGQLAMGTKVVLID